MGTTQSDPSELPHVNNIAGWRGTVDISLYSEWDVSYIMGNHIDDAYALPLIGGNDLCLT